MPRNLAGLVTLGVLLAACAPPPAPAAFPRELPPYAPGARFAVVGDLQRTSLLEFWREQNDAERARVVAALAALRPAFLVITGDLVFDGSSPRHWEAFDALTAPLHAASIPALATLGNHDYWSGGAGVEHLTARFPALGGRRYGLHAWGPLRLVLLDSNRGPLGRAAWAEQKAWYERTLAEIDADPEARGALVMLHHPAYTNSTVTGDEEHVQRDLVPPFLAGRKTLAMMSGHVHSYERFVRAGKTFVVSGGGGGPRARLLTGEARRHPDDRYPGPALRDFHFLVLTAGPEGLSAEVRGLPKGGEAFTPIDHFVLPYP